MLLIKVFASLLFCVEYLNLHKYNNSKVTYSCIYYISIIQLFRIFLRKKRVNISLSNNTEEHFFKLLQSF